MPAIQVLVVIIGFRSDFAVREEHVVLDAKRIRGAGSVCPNEPSTPGRISVLGIAGLCLLGVNGDVAVIEGIMVNDSEGGSVCSIAGKPDGNGVIPAGEFARINPEHLVATQQRDDVARRPVGLIEVNPRDARQRVRARLNEEGRAVDDGGVCARPLNFNRLEDIENAGPVV